MSGLEFDRRRGRLIPRQAVRVKAVSLYRHVDTFCVTLNDGLFALIAVLAIVLVIGVTSRLAEVIETAQVEAVEQAPPYVAP